MVLYKVNFEFADPIQPLNRHAIIKWPSLQMKREQQKENSWMHALANLARIIAHLTNVAKN